LTEGESFQKEFSDALINTTVVVAIVSPQALRGMIDRHVEQTDNLLVEWILALYCKNHPEQSRVRKIYPVMLSDLRSDGSQVTLFDSAEMNQLPDTRPVASVEDAIRLLQSNRVKVSDNDLSMMRTWTTKWIVIELLKNLGNRTWEIDTIKTSIAEVISSKVGNLVLEESANNSAVSKGAPDPAPAVETAYNPTVTMSDSFPQMPFDQLPVEAIGQLLKSKQMTKYVELFEEEEIDGMVLSTVTAEQLTEIGVKSIHVQKLMKLIEQWRQGDYH
jgi:hypothetical protein